MRVLLISLAVVFLAAMSLFTVRIWSLQSPTVRFDHPFFKTTSPHLAVRINTIEEGRLAIEKNLQIILWVDLRQTSDGRFFVLSPEKNGKLPVDRKVPQLSLSEVRGFLPEAPLLADIIEQFPQQRLILNVIDNTADVHQRLVEILKTAKPEERILIQSDTDVVLRSIKDLHPMWIFGSSRADWMKLMTFESIGLEPASPFRGDVLIVPLTVSGRSAVKPSLIAEIHRRQKDVLIGPLENAADYDAARQFSPNGFIFSSLKVYLESEQAYP